MDGESAEMKEIQEIMFGMGIGNEFTSTVTKETAGSNYIDELAKEIEQFVRLSISDYGGLIGLIDLYCVYNRSRGTDMISPEDLKNNQF